MAQFDEHDKTELELYVENTGELYEHKKKIIGIMLSRIESGRYELRGAVPLWRAWLDRGARMYQKEIERHSFPPALRGELAQDLAEKYEAAIRAHEYTRENMRL